MSRLGALALIAAVLIAGCGGSDPSQASARAGQRAGRSLVCVFSQAKYPTAVILGQDFQAWVAGDANTAGLNYPISCPQPPKHRLSPAARRAAAAVVIAWARTEADRLGPGALAQLRSQGVH